MYNNKIHMRTVITLGFLLSFFLTSCKYESLDPSNSTSRQEKNVRGFQSIDIRDGMRAFIRIDTFESVVIEANDNLHQHIYVRKEGSTLVVEMADNLRIKGSSTREVHITATSLEAIFGNGGSHISSYNDMNSNDFRIELGGGSILNMGLNAASLAADISGGSLLEILGSSDSYSLVSSGGSRATGYGFETTTLNCDVSGGGSLSITVNGSLEVDASGGSSISYKGDGVVDFQDLSGGSTLIKMP